MAKTQKPKLPKVAFTAADFKVADRFGRMYMRMIQPLDFELNDRDERYFIQLKRAYALIESGRPRRHIIATLQELDGGLWRNQADGMIKDAERLFINLGKVNKSILKAVHREKMLRLAELVEDGFLTRETVFREDKDGNEVEVLVFPYDSDTVLAAVEVVRKLWNDIAKYEQLDKPEANDAVGDELPDISFSDDKFELADYEDISQNSIHVEGDTAASEAVERDE